MYAESGDELEVTLREAKKNEVETGCPLEDNNLPQAGTNTDAHIWVEDGETNGEEDVYVWDDSDEIWDLEDGPGVDCYFDGNDPGPADPHHQGTVDVDSNGDGSTTFPLNAINANVWNGDQLKEEPAPGDGAAMLCVGTDATKNEDELEVADHHVGIFVPIVITRV